MKTFKTIKEAANYANNKLSLNYDAGDCIGIIEYKNGFAAVHESELWIYDTSILELDDDRVIMIKSKDEPETNTDDDDELLY